MQSLHLTCTCNSCYTPFTCGPQWTVHIPTSFVICGHTIITLGLPTTLKAANHNWCLVTLLVGSWYYHTLSYSNNHGPLLLIYLVGCRQEFILLCTLGCQISQTQLFLGSKISRSSSNNVSSTIICTKLFILQVIGCLGMGWVLAGNKAGHMTLNGIGTGTLSGSHVMSIIFEVKDAIIPAPLHVRV